MVHFYCICSGKVNVVFTFYLMTRGPTPVSIKSTGAECQKIFVQSLYGLTFFQVSLRALKHNQNNERYSPAILTLFGS